MIQRIQTVYLLGAVALVALCFFLPMAVFTNAVGEIDPYTFKGLAKNISGKGFNELLMFLSGVVVGASFLTIFFYKKRKRQMRACIIVIVLLIIVSTLVFIQIWHLKSGLGMTVTYKLPLVFPLISAVLTYLAYRGIKKDEELVRSYDRLR